MPNRSPLSGFGRSYVECFAANFIMVLLIFRASASLRIRERVQRQKARDWVEEFFSYAIVLIPQLIIRGNIGQRSHNAILPDSRSCRAFAEGEYYTPKPINTASIVQLVAFVSLQTYFA